MTDLEVRMTIKTLARKGVPNRAPDPQTLERLLNRLVRRIVRRLTRDGLLIEDPEQPWLDLEPADTLDPLNAASIRYRIAAGQGAGVSSECSRPLGRSRGISPRC
jgi:hypothetical protein